MMTDNKTRREIKLAYEEKRNAITYDFQRRQDAIDNEMERIRTDINYLGWLMRHGDDNCRDRINELTGQLSDLRRAKTKLDFERRRALHALKRERSEKLYECETIESERKEVAAV